MTENNVQDSLVIAAINKIIGTSSNMPVTGLDFNNASVRLAYNALMNTSELIQAEDWAFNSFFNFTFTPNKDKKIPYTNNILRIHLKNRPILNRDGYFFDISNNTFHFDRDLVVDEVVFKFEFKELPVLLRNYIIIKAAREFQTGANGSDRVDAYLQEQEYQAYISARDWDTAEGNYNMFHNLSVLLQNSRR